MDVITAGTRDDDVRAAADIWARAVARRDNTAAATVDDTLPGIRRRLELDGATLILARRDDVPRGFTLVAPRFGSLELFYLAVDPDAWGDGVGGALLETVDRHARFIGRTELELWVIADNLRAIAVYEAAGWARTADLQQTGTRHEGRLVRTLTPLP